MTPLFLRSQLMQRVLRWASQLPSTRACRYPATPETHALTRRPAARRSRSLCWGHPSLHESVWNSSVAETFLQIGLQNI
jgi:hypothetical protein